MNFRNITLLFAFVCVCLINNTSARDGSVVKTDWSKSDVINTQETVKETTATNEVKIPGRIHCNYEDATEDESCQEHCLPKGYSYGICVSHMCSCI